VYSIYVEDDLELHFWERIIGAAAVTYCMHAHTHAHAISTINHKETGMLQALSKRIIRNRL